MCGPEGGECAHVCMCACGPEGGGAGRGRLPGGAGCAGPCRVCRSLQSVRAVASGSRAWAGGTGEIPCCCASSMSWPAAVGRSPLARTCVSALAPQKASCSGTTLKPYALIQRPQMASTSALTPSLSRWLYCCRGRLGFCLQAGAGSSRARSKAAGVQRWDLAMLGWRAGLRSAARYGACGAALLPCGSPHARPSAAAGPGTRTAAHSPQRWCSAAGAALAPT